MITSLRHEGQSPLRANLANLTFASFCSGFSSGTTSAARCCKPLLSEKTSYASGAQFYASGLLCLGCYTSRTGAFLELGCQECVLFCRNICFLGPACSGLVIYATRLLISFNPLADKLAAAANMLANLASSACSGQLSNEVSEILLWVAAPPLLVTACSRQEDLADC